MKLNEKISVTFDITTYCNRGCSHCITEASIKNPKHFSLNLLSKLIKEIKRTGYQEVNFCFTGGGEPLLHPRLAELVDFSFNHLGSRLKTLSIVTSGFLSEENLERMQLTKLLQRSYVRRLTLALSFNLFNPKLPERFVNALSLIINSEKILRAVAIKMCLGCYNFKDSFEALENAFRQIEERTSSEISPYLVPPFWLTLSEMFSSKIWSQKKYRYLNSRVFAWPCAYVVDNRTNWLRMLEFHPTSLAMYGRAKNLKNLPLFKYTFCPSIFWPSKRGENEISISVDGIYYPRCCFAGKEIQLGKLSLTSLPEVFHKKRQFQTKMLRLLLADKRKYTPEEVCNICKNFKEMYF